VKGLYHAGGDPLVPPAPQRGGGAGGVGDAGIGTTEDEHLDQLIEDDAIGNLGPIAT
jgi:hypothetical protein